MGNFICRAILVLVVAAFSIHFTQGQQKEFPKERKKDLLAPLVRPQPSQEVDSAAQERVQRRILNQVQSGISKGDASLFAHHLGPQVYLSLKGAEGGYYSANQAFYVLQNFFSTHRPASFTFSTHGEIEENPFATGRGYFSVRGVRESVQVYVSLTQYQGRWVVAEFNVY